MPNYNLKAQQSMADLRVGLRVDTVSTSIAGATAKRLFDIYTGNVVVFGLIGWSAAGVDATANNAFFNADPDVGSDVAMCATADIASTEAGGLVYITGTVANAMVALAAGAGAAVMMATPIIVAPGYIEFVTDADSVGSFVFSIWYVPAEDGAYILAH